MTLLHRLAIAGTLAVFSLGVTTSAYADTADQAAESQAFLGSKTSLMDATATAEVATSGKVSAIEYQTGENGAPDVIMAEVTLADGTEKTVAINPDDGKVLKIALADGEHSDSTETDENANN